MMIHPDDVPQLRAPNPHQHKWRANWSPTRVDPEKRKSKRRAQKLSRKRNRR